jgi:hypothetical protein
VNCEIDEDLLFPLRHRQVAIRYNDLAADVDEGIADLILACWRDDIWTWGVMPEHQRLHLDWTSGRVHGRAFLDCRGG